MPAVREVSDVTGAHDQVHEVLLRVNQSASVLTDVQFDVVVTAAGQQIQPPKGPEPDEPFDEELFRGEL